MAPSKTPIAPIRRLLIRALHCVSSSVLLLQPITLVFTSDALIGATGRKTSAVAVATTFVVAIQAAGIKVLPDIINAYLH